MVTLVVNWLAVVVATIVAMIIGFVWFSPALFGNAWMESMRMKKGAKMKMSGKAFVGALVSAFVTALALGLLIGIMHVTTLKGGFELAAGLWLGFFATKELVRVSFGSTSSKMFGIQVAHDLVVLLLMAAVFILI